MMRIKQSNNQPFNLMGSKQNNNSKDINFGGETRDDHNRLDSNQELSPEEKKRVQELKQIERKVESHEQAHKSVGGQFAGAMTYSYTQGPDNQRYKTGGEVGISIPSDDDPKKMIAQLMQVKRAALAPSNPSSQDIKVAGMVDGKLQAARAKLREAYSKIQPNEIKETKEEKKKSFDLKI